MDLNVLKIGNRVEITEITDKEDVEKKIYVSQICDVFDDGSIELLMPVFEGRLIPLPEGEYYDIFISTNAGLYTSVIRTRKRYKSENIYMISADVTSKITRYQRREFFRLELSEYFKFKKLDENELNYYIESKQELESLINKPVYEGSMLDLSGGGIRYLTREKNKKGDNIIVYVRLTYNKGIKDFVIIGNVLSSVALMDRPGFFEERIQFSKIPKDDREAIIKYIFEVERKRRQKEVY